MEMEEKKKGNYIVVAAKAFAIEIEEDNLIR